MPTHSWDILNRLDGRLSDALAAQVERWARQPEIVAAKPAASVVLLRDGSDGIQTYLLHRHARMPFAPNMVVFPGGRVDPGDGDDPAAAVLNCALRETAEETGVALDAGDLVAWAHWITPEFEPRRYDTYFYLAALPNGQTAADISGETDSAAWAGPGEALRAADDGDLGLMPPTRSLLLELNTFATVANALAAGTNRHIETVLPRAVEENGHWLFRYPTVPEPVEGPLPDRPAVPEPVEGPRPEPSAVPELVEGPRPEPVEGSR